MALLKAESQSWYKKAGGKLCCLPPAGYCASEKLFYFAFQSLRSWGFSMYEGIFSKIFFMRFMSNLVVRS